jgi:ribosomal-protein-alanine N-acetyltransferase
MHVDDLDNVMVNENREYAFPWTRGIFVDCLSARHECWIACLAEAIIGHSVLSVAAREAHLLNLCVCSSEQKKGYGREFMLHMIDRAVERKAKVIFLEVRPSNHVAFRLYDSLGFNEIGRRKNYYPSHDGHEDAQILALQLDLSSL